MAASWVGVVEREGDPFHVVLFFWGGNLIPSTSEPSGKGLQTDISSILGPNVFPRPFLRL